MIIDSHVHIGGHVADFEMTEEDVIYSLNTYKIDSAIVSNADSVECDGSHNPLKEDRQISQYNSTVRTINFARDYPKRIYVAPWLKPLTQVITKDFVDLLDRNLDIVKAFKVHPFYSALPFDSERLEPYLEVAQKFELPVIVHCALDNYSNPDIIFRVAQKHPYIKFVAAHMGLETDHKATIELCKKLPNLYADTAWVNLDATVDFVNNCGSDRLFFGSDSPIDGRDTYARNKAGQRSLYQEYFFDLPARLNPQDYENIMFKNAQRIYKI